MLRKIRSAPSPKEQVSVSMNSNFCGRSLQPIGSGVDHCGLQIADCGLNRDFNRSGFNAALRFAPTWLAKADAYARQAVGTFARSSNPESSFRDPHYR